MDTFIFTEFLNVIFDQTADVHGSTFHSSAFLAGDEAGCGLIALEIDSTLVAFRRQAHILNHTFLIGKFVYGVARV